MNNDKSNKGASQPQDTGSQPRVRTQSECSYSSDDGAAAALGKRQRTTSQQFLVSSGLTAASPPKFVSLEEIMQAANGMRDMALVHEIVIDDDFKLKKLEPEANTVGKVLSDTMRRAFWDILRNQLAEDPPEYKQAFILLEDIKQALFALLLPQHTKIRQQISEILDTEMIKQQAEQGVLNFENYAQYIVSVMSKLCAPVRDESIKALTERTDVVDTFKGILETLDLMQLDMANFALQMARSDIIASSVEWEREKFANFLAIQPDGLEYTRKWLLKYINPNEPLPENIHYANYIKFLLRQALVKACRDLLDWDKNTPYPETFMLDEERIMDLETRTNRLIWIATILLVTLCNTGADLQSIADFKDLLKEHILILLQTAKTEKDLNEILPNVAEQVATDIKEAHKKYNLPEFSQAAEQNLKQQILETGKADHKVRGIVKQRVKDFFLDIVESATAAPQKVPSGLTALQKELTQIAGQFLRIVSHNSTVFSNYYFDIVAEVVPKPA